MYKINMTTKQYPYGTSLMGEITITFDRLVKLFGKPNAKGDDYKTDVEWWGEINGEFFTIYNYKTGKNYLGKEGLAVEKITDWHIGAYNKETATKLIAYMQGDNKDKIISDLQDKLHRRNKLIDAKRREIAELKKKLEQIAETLLGDSLEEDKNRILSNILNIDL